MTRTPAWLERRSMLTPARAALVLPDEVVSWATLAERVARRAAQLAAAGVRAGDVVATLLENGRAFVELAHAAGRCGATLLPLDVRLGTPELDHALRETGAGWLVHGAGPFAEAAAAASGDVERLATEPAGDARRLEEVAITPRDPRPRSHVDLDQTLAILLTSGTTGRPKGAELTHGNFLWSAVGSAMHLGASPDDRWLACLPLFHVGGLAILMRSVLWGSAVVIQRRFEPERVARSLEGDGISLVSLVPTMLIRLLDAWGQRPPPARLRCVLLGGGPIPGALLERAWGAGWPVAPTYGLTEASSQVATLPLDEIGRRRDVAGKPLAVTQVAIAGRHGEALPAREAGEILVRGPTVMKGYRRRPGATARALRDGWLHTGDVGRLDEAGFLQLLERRRDLIVSGGENVYPAEVESALCQHPAVREAAVAPVPDLEFGQRVVAWVALRAGAQASPEQLRSFCRSRLAGYKVPRAVHLVAALPRTASGKLLRRALSEPGRLSPRPPS